MSKIKQTKPLIDSFEIKQDKSKIIVETMINQEKAELLGTLSLTEEGKLVFMDLVLASNGDLVCTFPKNAVEVKQVGVKR